MNGDVETAHDVVNDVNSQEMDAKGKTRHTRHVRCESVFYYSRQLQMHLSNTDPLCCRVTFIILCICLVVVNCTFSIMGPILPQGALLQLQLP